MTWQIHILHASYLLTNEVGYFDIGKAKMNLTWGFPFIACYKINKTHNVGNYSYDSVTLICSHTNWKEVGCI